MRIWKKIAKFIIRIKGIIIPFILIVAFVPEIVV
jgi:hypothetical protein